MDKLNRYIYPLADEMVSAFVCDFMRFLLESALEKEPVHVALSGGSTPLAVFKELAAKSSPENWEFVHLYWSDERCVKPGHPDSNYGQARKHLIDPLAIPDSRVHRIWGEAHPAVEALRYAKLLKEGLPEENGLPVFDWVWLGMGADGHTASIFPDQLNLWKAEAICVQSKHPGSGQARISLTGGILNAAKRVSILLSGEEKAPVIREVFHKEGAYLSYPISHIQPVLLEWFLDQEAAGQL